MWKRRARLSLNFKFSRSQSTKSRLPVVKIENGTFYRHHPSTATSTLPNPPLFSKLNFDIPASASTPTFWSILGPSSAGKTTFLQILRGQLLCDPPTSRSYPFLNSDFIAKKDGRLRNPVRAISYVGFGNEGNSSTPRGAYLSARYESRREETDWSVMNYLRGQTSLNRDEASEVYTDETHLQQVISDLRLQDLTSMPVANLSNGQTRRAKIAKALLEKPEILLLDEPFMGLDPPTLMSLSPLLHRLAEDDSPRLVLALRPQDPIPEWITHLLLINPGCQIAFSGPKNKVLEDIRTYVIEVTDGRRKPDLHMSLTSLKDVGRILTHTGVVEHVSLDAQATSAGTGDVVPISKSSIGETIVQMSGVIVSYGSKTVLGNWTQEVNGKLEDGLWWTIRRGQRWGIFGPNGSGKTTILSLICSDHPKTYSLPILLFGKSRLPEPGVPGISIFDLQLQMGHSSPEIHHFIPRSLSLRKVLENAWAETFQARPKLDGYGRRAIDEALRWFEPELRRSPATILEEHDTKWADDLLFGGLPFSTQRLALFIRALIKKPSLVILDEAFSGMDEAVRDKCMLFLHHGTTKTYIKDASGSYKIVDSDLARRGTGVITGIEERQALLCISHVREEIPACIREWICLPEANTGLPARFGRLNSSLRSDAKGWNDIWSI